MSDNRPHVPVADLRANFKKWIEHVIESRQAIVITRYGKPAAVMLPAEEWEGMASLARDMIERDASSGNDSAIGL